MPARIAAMLTFDRLGPDAGTPLLIAHGLFGSARNWGVIAKRLSARRPVIAVDMRNHADSPWDDAHGYPEMADDLEWFSKGWERVRDFDYTEGRIEWFKGGKLNVSYNCLDRHLGTPTAKKTAIIWQGEAEDAVQKYTYEELHREVCKFANVLKAQGIKKGDRVAIYMPMVIELPIAMLACARIGAIHSVIFGGFSADSIADRVNDSDCKMVITANVLFRGGKTIGDLCLTRFQRMH